MSKTVKRIILVLSVFVFVLSAGACGDEKNKEQLTVDKVIELSAKGEELTWSDFEQYESTDVGSGLYIPVYDIDENFELWIGGSPDDTPMYMRLVTKSDRDNFVEIRTGDVKAFVEANAE